MSLASSKLTDNWCCLVMKTPRGAGSQDDASLVRASMVLLYSHRKLMNPKP